jgi:Ala-tRNA(Pro) deacylase
MPATEQDLLDKLGELEIKTTLFRHPPLFTVEDSQNLRGEIPGGHCKNLFLKDKKHNFILAVLSEDRQVDLKALYRSGNLPVGRLSFASAERMVDVLGIKPGAVTPFSLINVENKNLIVVLDKTMLEHDYLNYHPLHNEATLTIHRNDLIKFIEHFGFRPIIMDFDNL